MNIWHDISPKVITKEKFTAAPSAKREPPRPTHFMNFLIMRSLLPEYG